MTNSFVQISMTHITDVNETYHILKWLMTHINESRHINKCVMLQTWMSHITHVNEPRHMVFQSHESESHRHRLYTHTHIPTHTSKWKSSLPTEHDLFFQWFGVSVSKSYAYSCLLKKSYATIIKGMISLSIPITIIPIMKLLLIPWWYCYWSHNDLQWKSFQLPDIDGSWRRRWGCLISISVSYVSYVIVLVLFFLTYLCWSLSASEC